MFDAPLMSDTVTQCERCGARLPGGTLSGMCPLCFDEPEGAPPGARVLGDCELFEEIGRGGMGVVWRGRQRGLNRDVAVKTLPGGDLASAAARARFRTEAQAAARLSHPGIVAVHDVGEADGMPYFVMELVGGRTLAAILAEKPPAIRNAARWLRDAALAVQHAHEQGVLHRDLKPSNILIEPFEDGDRPRVTDFGLARLTDSDSTLSASLAPAGTPAYMPPEQARQGQSDARSDVYSLGAVLYATLTGRAPFHGESVITVLDQVAREEPLSPRRLNASVPRDLENICLKCLEKNPARRYASARGLADDLDRFLLGSPVLARPLSRTQKLLRLAQRHPWHAAAAALAVIMVAGVIFSLAWKNRTEHRHQIELAAEQKATQLALLRSRLGEARAIVNLREPDSRPRAESIVREVIAARPLDDILREARNVAIAALALPSARAEPLRGEGVTTDDWTMSAGDLARDRWALATYEGRVALRGLASEKDTSVFNTAPRPITALIAFSPGGRWLAIRHREELCIWDTAQSNAASPAFLAKPWSNGLAFSFTKAAFSPDDLAVLWAAEDSVVAAALPDGKEISRWRGGGGAALSASALAFDPTGKWVAVARSDKPEMELRHWPGGETAQVFQGLFSRPLVAVALTADASRLAGADVSGRITVWQRVNAMASLWDLGGHTEAVRSLTFSPDGRLLVSTGEDGKLRVWDCAAASEMTTLPFDAAVLTFSPDGRRIGVGHSGGRLVSAVIEPSPCLHRFRPVSPPQSPQMFSICPDGKSLACLSAGGAVRCAVPGGETQETFSFTNPYAVLAEPRLGGALLVSGPAGVVRHHATIGANGVTLFPASRWGWDSLTASADDRWLAASENAGARAAVWPAGDIDSRRAVFLKTDNRGSGPLALSPDGTRAAVAFRYDPGLLIYDVAAGNILRRLELPPRHSLAWSPDGRWLAACGAATILWDTATWQVIPLPGGAPNHPPAGGVAFSWPDDTGAARLLAHVSGDSLISLISIPGFQSVTQLTAPETGSLYKLEFARDHHWLGASTARGGICLWDLPALRRSLAERGIEIP